MKTNLPSYFWIILLVSLNNLQKIDLYQSPDTTIELGTACDSCLRQDSQL